MPKNFVRKTDSCYYMSSDTGCRKQYMKTKTKTIL